MRGDAFIHFVSGCRRVNIRLGVLLLIPKSPHNKKCLKFRASDKYWQLFKEKKLGIASYNNPNKLPNQRSEILNISTHKMLGYLVGKI